MELAVGGAAIFVEMLHTEPLTADELLLEAWKSIRRAHLMVESVNDYTLNVNWTSLAMYKDDNPKRPLSLVALTLR